MGERISTAGYNRLLRAPDDWERMPFFGDMRPMGPLQRKGLFEERKIDVTPADWASGPVRVVRHEWRITEAGRQALRSTSSQSRLSTD